MTWSLATPWGLLGLLSLPLIHWLHRHVLIGERRDISAAHLWRDSLIEPSEGKRREQPPLNRVELCELACAALLSLWLAGLDVEWGLRPTTHLGLVIDASASMSSRGASAPLQQARDRLEELIGHEPDSVLTLIAAGHTARVLGEARITPEQARQQLQKFEPDDSVSRMDSALTLAQSLGLSLHQLWIVSDDPQLSHPRLIRVGSQQPNQAVVSASWQPESGPFFAVRNFSEGAVQLEARWLLDGVPHVQELKLGPLSELPLQLAPELWEPAQRVELELPADALAIDDRAVLLRPDRAPVAIAVTHPSAALRTALEKATRAIAGLTLAASGNADIVVEPAAPESSAPGTSGNASGPPSRAALRLRIAEGTAGESKWQRELGIDPFSPLAAGLDVDGLVWYGQPASDGADSSRSVLSSPGGALIHHGPSSITLQIDLERSNFLAHPAFPILLSNLASQADLRRGGFPRSNLRQGEVLTVFRSAELQGNLTLVSPGGHSTHFEASTNPVPLGRLAHHGIYELRSDEQVEQLSVNFLHPEESDLEERKPASQSPPPLQLETSPDTQPVSPLRWLLLLLAGVCLLLAWHGLLPRAAAA